jgi:DNA polymerase-3 subunit beta
MKFSIQREALLVPISQVVGVVERRQTLPVLANFLLEVDEDQLRVTGSDMEVEMVGTASAEVAQSGAVTVPARKLVDICKALPEGVRIDVQLNGEKLALHAGRSRFTLATLPAAEFPSSDATGDADRMEVPEDRLHWLMDKTSFAMANQDVRHYLNGLLLEFRSGMLRAVATDGHRLALAEMEAQCRGRGSIADPSAKGRGRAFSDARGRGRACAACAGPKFRPGHSTWPDHDQQADRWSLPGL